MRELTARYGAKLFVNDRNRYCSLRSERTVFTWASCHFRMCGKKRVEAARGRRINAWSAEAQRAVEEGADFLTLGPVFQTPSKMQYGAPVGLDVLKEVVAAVPVPVFGIGGIKDENVSAVMQTGAYGIG